MRSLTRAEVRSLDQRAIDEFRMPGTLLMENAGRGCAELLLQLGAQRRIVICCGRGNNGGDGFVMARHLQNAGLEVEVVLFAHCDAVTGDAAVNLRIVQAAGIRLQEMSDAEAVSALPDRLAAADWIVDALLGTGTRGEIREPYRTAIEAINGSRRPVLSVDLPSGLDCDTGEPLGPCIRARCTATLVAFKRGFENPASREWTGEVHVVGIGAPQQLLTSSGSLEQ